MDNDKTVQFESPDHTSERFVIERISNTHGPAIEDFCKAIIEERDPLINGVEGSKAQELVAAITLSGCTGDKVSLPVDRKIYDDLISGLKGAQKLPDQTSTL